MRPLEPIGDGEARDVIGTDRFVPGVTDGLRSTTAAPATGEFPLAAVPAMASGPGSEVGSVPQPSLAPADMGEQAKAPPAPDVRPETPRPPAAAPVSPGQQPAPKSRGGRPRAAQPPVASEETAAVVDPKIGEETGAAKSPSGPAPEGEFAQAEEVGSPDAATQSTTAAE